MALSTIKNYTLAIELINFDARTSIISEATGIYPKLLSKAYFDTHNKTPSSKSLKFNPKFVYKSIFENKRSEFGYFIALK